MGQRRAGTADARVQPDVPGLPVPDRRGVRGAAAAATSRRAASSVCRSCRATGAATSVGVGVGRTKLLPARVGSDCRCRVDDPLALASPALGLGSASLASRLAAHRPPVARGRPDRRKRPGTLGLGHARTLDRVRRTRRRRFTCGRPGSRRSRRESQLAEQSAAAGAGGLAA